jgi:hypothetical protein
MTLMCQPHKIPVIYYNPIMKTLGYNPLLDFPTDEMLGEGTALLTTRQAANLVDMQMWTICTQDVSWVHV